MKSEPCLRADNSDQVDESDEKKKNQSLKVLDTPDESVSELGRKNNIEESRNEEIAEEEDGRSTPMIHERSRSHEEECEFKLANNITLERNMFVWLVGSSTYIETNKNLISWSMFGRSRRNRIFGSTKFSSLVSEMNNLIKYLNCQKKFAQVQPRSDECKAFLYRLGEYKDEKQTYYCLPLRF